MLKSTFKKPCNLRHTLWYSLLYANHRVSSGLVLIYHTILFKVSYVSVFFKPKSNCQWIWCLSEIFFVLQSMVFTVEAVESACIALRYQHSLMIKKIKSCKNFSKITDSSQNMTVHGANFPDCSFHNSFPFNEINYPINDWIQ